uniref:Uncharacterized protein n=1 Tax=Tanacetum cinerariifolium TaxID=118510 RepID=A0A699HEM5_TANCI|nr:hypothetical protein [Tanacetum cinerariifolium]
MKLEGIMDLLNHIILQSKVCCLNSQDACWHHHPADHEIRRNYGFVESYHSSVQNLTQEILVGPTFKLLKGTCKSLTELEYHLEECSKATTKRLDWHNPEGKPYPFDLSKPLMYIRYHQGRQVIPQDFFINNDLEYLKGEDLSRRISIMKKYDYGNMEEIEFFREDQKLYKFKEGVKSYQKKLNLTKPDTFRLNLRNRTTYTAYSDPKGVIYKDQVNRNRSMHAIELHKFSDGAFNDVRSALHAIAKGIRMEYLPKRKWSGLDKRRSRVMIQDIDKQLYERRLMQNLEKFIGGREYENDLRLLEWTI